MILLGVEGMHRAMGKRICQASSQSDPRSELTLDFETEERRASCKDDAAKMALVPGYLSSIAFYWPMVSAQDCGVLAPLHELDTSFNNTVKHIRR